MILTNKSNLPESIVRAIQADDYDKNADFSVSDLIAPAQQVQLRKKHSDQIEEDVLEKVWSLYGKAFHHVLQLSAEPDCVAEKRFYKDIVFDPMHKAVKLSGQIDLYDPKIKTLYDYKSLSVWNAVYGSRTADYIKQLNCYNYLMGGVAENLVVVAIYRDWHERDTLKNNDLPRVPIQEIRLPVQDKETIERWIVERLYAIHTESECTKAEMWESDTKYAIMKEGRKSAINGGIHSTQESAQSMIETLAGGHYIEERPGERRRCARYCNVAKLCPQYRNYLTSQPVPALMEDI